MAACPDCHREMRLAPSCVTDFAVTVGDKTFDRVRHPASATERCEDCGVKPGGVHHFGCDMEQCPSCGGQLIMCAGSSRRQTSTAPPRRAGDRETRAR